MTGRALVLDFGGVITKTLFATHTGILMPDPRAYEFVTDGLRISADDCVLVDDQLKNIRGAETAGWQVVHFDVTAPARGR